MINIKDKSDCNGCCACVDICPPNSISLKTDIEGFWYPLVDLKTCTDCGLCEKTCPELHAEELKKNDYEKPITYAAIHKNLEVRFDSTSGGLFSALAEKTYKDGGYVGGAIYNDDFSVRHFISNNKKDLSKLRSSKYLQSDASGLYIEVKKLLKEGEKVLVCGTPCQMAGLRSFLNKDYDNLIIVDFVCRGVNSPRVFRKYLDSLEKRVGSKINYIKAKSKELGWRKLTWKFTFENGENLFETKDENLFTRGYLHTNVYCRPSCYDCKFKGFPRIADITVADFWGIENVEKSLDNDLGTSMVLINSKKGEAYFEQIKPKIQYKKVEFENILPGNPVLIASLGKPIINREQFFHDLEKSSFDEIASKYFPFEGISAKRILLNLLKSLLEVKRMSRFRPLPIYQFIKYNFFKIAIKTNWKQGAFLVPAPDSIIEINNGAKIELNGRLLFGFKRIKKSKLESRLLIEKDGKLLVNGNFTFYYGADIEVFKGGELIINGEGGANINATIICAEKIVLGKGVQIGRNVTIRDNNGGHYISRQGYKNSRPVIIGDRAWLGEGCTIMPGVKIGEGAIIGANSLVLTNVPANSIVLGNPAKVVDKDVLWKY